MKEFQVNKKKLADMRIINLPDMTVGDGQVRVKVDAFSFSANNITYWAMGEKMSYWQFFPAADNKSLKWGIIPVWGFADVIESKHQELPVGERLFGYFPTAETCMIEPKKLTEQILFDGSTHRSNLPPGYNMYRRVKSETQYDSSQDALRMLLFPLHITSFCLYDMLASNQWFNAEQLIITSASSKTSLGLAFALHEDKSAPPVLGLTSTRNLGFVEQTAYYQKSLTYDEVNKIDNHKKTVIVDMSGHGQLISQLHALLKVNMLYTSLVGLTHREELRKGPDYLADRSHVFFAPTHIQQRYQDWGPEKFEKQATSFMKRAAIDSANWLEIKTVENLSGLKEQFNAVSEGLLPADQGLIIKL